MKRLVNFLILVYIIVTMLVMIMNPKMHKPVALENVNFNFKNQIMNPQERFISDFEVKVKFHRAKPLVAKVEEEKEITIPIEEDEKPITFEFEDNKTSVQETTFEIAENVSDSETEMEVDVSSNDETYSEENLDYYATDIESREINVDLSDNIPKSRNKDVNLGKHDITQKDVELKASDEVGSLLFKATREEVIAWNVWRSELQNQIMIESAIEAPVGTLISFSFDVSADGRISGLKYSCSSRKYADEAKADMIRVLEKLEYTDILKFPENTKRLNVKFKGAFMLDYSTSFSKPSDYSDYEKVRY